MHNAAQAVQKTQQQAPYKTCQKQGAITVDATAEEDV
jgi:hypothetical protein